LFDIATVLSFEADCGSSERELAGAIIELSKVEHI